jgi:hypothetical protein
MQSDQLPVNSYTHLLGHRLNKQLSGGIYYQPRHHSESAHRNMNQGLPDRNLTHSIENGMLYSCSSIGLS